ncbi:hypothetical protein AB0K43_05245 [Kitasatospora sp. NPDC049258]|uniref:hypothetical protein n=1 Tax=Kitasatospora sp. NPDC049258 TaxID=3155394 RepID=UPI003416AB02
MSLTHYEAETELASYVCGIELTLDDFRTGNYRAAADWSLVDCPGCLAGRPAAPGPSTAADG